MNLFSRLRQTGTVDRIRILAQALDDNKEPASLKPLFVLIIASTAVAIAAGAGTAVFHCLNSTSQKKYRIVTSLHAK